MSFQRLSAALLAASLAPSLALGAAALKLIPSPQSVVVVDGSFVLSPRVPIVLADAKDADDRFAAQQLAEESKIDLGRGLPIRASARGPHILIGQLGRDKAVDVALARLGVDAPARGALDAYVLTVRSDGIVVAGWTSAGTFYGVQTLKQLLRQSPTIPCLTIVDWAALKIRGWQDDISRGPIPTLEFLKREIRTLSEFKLNAFTMYTEHVFRLKKHPTIAPKDGITAEEVRELCKYAKRYHVEVIGNFQSFGHFANILQVKGYEKLGEAGWLLSPAKEESYQFLKDVYGEIAPAYESPLFDINCDETGGLGSGASKEMVQKMGVGAVYAQHINRIADLLRPLGKTPMMWGDIALQHPDIVPRLPKDLIVLSWGYHAGDSFDGAILPFTKLGLRFLVCPGVSCWSQIFPDYQSAAINISNYVRDGARHGALGMMNTTWDDDGENLFSYNWEPLAWGAECSWKPAIPEKWEDRNTLREERLTAFRKAFSSAFFGLSDDSAEEALWNLSALRQRPWSGGLGDGAFWTEMAVAARQSSTLEEARDLRQRAETLAIALDRAQAHAKHNADSLAVARFAARRVGLMGMRAMAAKLLSDAADPFVRSALGTLSGALVDDSIDLMSEYQSLWRSENRPWWLDRNQRRYLRSVDASLKMMQDYAPLEYERRKLGAR